MIRAGSPSVIVIEKGPTMLIVQLTDLQIRPHGVAANRVAETNMLSEHAPQAVVSQRPTPYLLVISDELTERGLREEYAVVAEMLPRMVKIPVYVIPGNHDRRENRVARLPTPPLDESRSVCDAYGFGRNLPAPVPVPVSDRTRLSRPSQAGPLKIGELCAG
jgi:3',5'-cyclic AMP phosphodiesterase CpdA